MGDFELPAALLTTFAVVIAIFLARKVIGWVISLVILVVALAAAGFYLWNSGILERVIETGIIP